MANPQKGELAFRAGDREYTLAFTHDSLVQLEDTLDRGLLAIINEMQTWGKDPTRIRLGWLRAMLWAGLRKHHPAVDLIAAGEMIGKIEGGAGTVLSLTTEAVGRAFNVPGEAARPTGEEPPTNGTGSNSSPTMSASGSTQETSGTSLLVN